MNVFSFGKKTLFMLTTSAAAKNYKTGTAKLMSSWKNNVPLKDITFKVIHIMYRILLQKLSKASKAKHQLKALGRRNDLWSNDLQVLQALPALMLGQDNSVTVTSHQHSQKHP